MGRQVVVGFDGSPMSMDAVAWAAGQAVSRQASLRIVACYEVPAESAMVPLAIGVVGSLAKVVEAGGTVALQKVKTHHPLLDAVLEVCAGPPASVLAHESQSVELLVVGGSGHHGAAAFWLGSTARSVARHSACPVAVVRGIAATDGPKRIVVGVDESAEADAAVRWAADEADRACAMLVLVHCWWYAYEPLDVDLSQARELVEIDAACVLDRAVEAARERCGVDVVGILLESNPITALLSMAGPGDVLVLGSPSHGAILSSVLGSTVNGVLEKSAVPVIIVPTAVAAASEQQTSDSASR